MKLLTRLLLFSIPLAAASACSAMPESPTPENLAELPQARQLQRALEQALREGQGAYDLGISAAVIKSGYQPWTGVAGNSQPDVPVSSEMLFNAGSIAKSFEAALALKLGEQGLLDLDEPISKWLPAYENIDPRISVRQLMNHTSGVFNVFEHPDFPWVGPQVDYTRQWRLGETIESFVLAPYGAPGTVQHYASTNYLLLTAILEQVTGMPVPQVVEESFFDTLALNHSFMSMGELPPASFQVAHPWVDVNLDGKLEDLSGAPQTWIASLTHPALYATPADLARWMFMLYHEQSVLSAAALQEMLTIPEVQHPDPEGGRYGLGVVDYSEILGVRVIGHAGSALGSNAAALYFPEQGVAVAWAFNTGESPAELASQLMQSTWKSLSQVLLK